LITQPIHYITIVALKTVYLLHQYYLNGPPEVLIQDEFNVDEFLTVLNGVWSKRLEQNEYDEEVILIYYNKLLKDLMKNDLASKFIIESTEFLYKKICFLKKYPFIENNYSLEQTIVNFSYFDYNSLLEKNLIKELLQLYSSLLDLFLNIPISISQLAQIFDTYLQVLNEEIIYIFTLLFLIIVAFKNNTSKNKKDEIITMFDEKFFEMSHKFNEAINKYKNFRHDIISKYYFLEIPHNFSLYLKNLNNNLKQFPNFEFNTKAYYMQVLSKDIIGIKMHHSMAELIDMDLMDFPEKYKFQPENVFEADANEESRSIQSMNHNYNSINSLELNNINNKTNKQHEGHFNNYYSTLNNPNNSKNNDKGKMNQMNQSRFDFNEDKFNNSFHNFNFEDNKYYNNCKNKQSLDNNYYDSLRHKLQKKTDDLIIYNNNFNPNLNQKTELFNDKGRYNKTDDKNKPENVYNKSIKYKE